VATQATDPAGPRLIVNADDFGYFRCVSQGIVEAHARGIVTATAVMANLPRFREDLDLLSAHSRLDIGVHLNLTHGRPLSPSLAGRIGREDGCFPSKFRLAGMLATGRLRPGDVLEEWSLQIQSCLDAGLRPIFLNSHEHLHMLPSLAPVIGEAANRFAIRHIRLPAPGPGPRARGGDLLRNLALGALARRTPTWHRPGTPVFVGLEASGRLNSNYLAALIPRLEPGRTYELMCHPGILDDTEVADPALLGYHEWDGEMAALTADCVRALLDRHRVRLIGYRDLAQAGGPGGGT